MIEFATSTAILGDGTVVVSVVGELDLNAAPAFEKELLACVRRQLDNPVLVDLTRCDYVDSTALRVLVRARTCLVESEPLFAVITTDERMLRLFKSTGLDRYIAIHSRRPAVRGPAVTV